MKNGFTPRRLATAAAAAAVLLMVLPKAAGASVGTSCSFDSGTAAVTATIGSGASATLERNFDAIWFGGAPCGSADVTNTDAIDVTAPDTLAAESLTISIAGGSFAPGKTTEIDGDDEIEITANVADEDAVTIRGSAGPDVIGVEPWAVDLIEGTPGEDEVFFASSSLAEVNLVGRVGADSLRLRTYRGTVLGGPGNDSVTPEVHQPSSYRGGAGDDLLTFNDPVGMILQASGGGIATIQRSGGGTDTATGFEAFAGGDAPDFFVGSAGGDRLIGNGGDDRFIPVGGDDVIEGGGGFDQLLFGGSADPVTVHLTDAMATGEGTDSFADIEVVGGTELADHFIGDPRTSGIVAIDGYGGRDVLDVRTATHRQYVMVAPGWPSANPSWVRLVAAGVRRVIGGPLRDRIVAGATDGAQLRVRFSGSAGDDSLVGGAHHDVLRGDAGDDHLDGHGGRDICDGGPGTDTVFGCEA